MSIQLQWESVADVFEEFSPLFDEHYFEIYGKRINVKQETILHLEQNGALLLLVAREDGAPIGYYSCTCTPTIYNSEVIEARDIGIYVIPEKRNQGITTAMQDTMDLQLKEYGISYTFVSYPNESTIPTSQGYRVKEIVYQRML